MALGDPEGLARELAAAGYRTPRIDRVIFDYQLDVAMLDDPETLFGMSADWVGLSDEEKSAVIAEARRMAGDRAILPIPSTALIGVAER